MRRLAPALALLAASFAMEARAETAAPARLATEARDVVDHSFSVSEILTFENEVDQRIYQDHPIHKRFVAEYSALWDRVAVYDVANG